MKKHIRNNFIVWLYHWISPFGDPRVFFSAFPGYTRFLKDWQTYKTLDEAEDIRLLDTVPCLGDRTETSPFDAHYFYQDIWAARNIYESQTKTHIDVGSRVDFVGFLTSFTEVTFVDLRPLPVHLKNFRSVKGDILQLPFENDSVSSLSCLHTAEHIGLGRYGDTLDPAGTKKACRELARVLGRGGNLFFSLPVGKPRIQFNAHRIHAPRQIQEYFSDLELVEFSGINDQGEFLRHIDPSSFENANYSCGLFRFTKR